MLRLPCVAARRELASLACSWRRNTLSAKPETHGMSWWHQRARTHASCASSPEHAWHRMRRPPAHCRRYSNGADRGSGDSGGSAGSGDSGHPGITVVGSPDPVTWIRNKFVLLLIELYFGLSFSVEFDSGVKQAVVHVSAMLSRGQFQELRSVMSREAVESVRKRWRSLSDAQKTHLAISPDDVIFLLPEDVSIFFDQTGRKFVYITMRLWYLSSADVPEDPESSRIFRMDSTAEDGPQKKIITAVYEFYRELSAEADPEWTVTRLWHWKQLE